MVNTVKGLGLGVPVSDRDHVQGPPGAAVTIVQYGDYECPACHKALAAIADVQTQLAGRVRFVFRHFPVKELHPNAQRAAEAAEAAGEQGRFWLMHDFLLANQTALSVADIRRYAADIGLDMLKFSSAFDSRKFSTRVMEDVMGGTKSGVIETPTFFVNGERFFWKIDSGTLLTKAAAAANAAAKA